MTTKDPNEIISVDVCVLRTVMYEGTIKMKRSEFDQLSDALDSSGTDLLDAKEGIYELAACLIDESYEDFDVDYFDIDEDEEE